MKTTPMSQSTIVMLAPNTEVARIAGVLLLPAGSQIRARDEGGDLSTFVVTGHRLVIADTDATLMLDCKKVG